jgi:hypothetical protein
MLIYLGALLIMLGLRVAGVANGGKKVLFTLIEMDKGEVVRAVTQRNDAAGSEISLHFAPGALRFSNWLDQSFHAISVKVKREEEIPAGKGEQEDA